MEADQDGEAIDNYFNDISSSQSQSSRRSSQHFQAAPVPQSHVANRRNRRVADGKDKTLAAEPGFGNGPVNVTKTRKVLYDALKSAASHSKAATAKKDCFSNPLLDHFAEGADYLNLEETGDFIKYSAIVYAQRVDMTFDDAMSTNCQLRPTNAKGGDEQSKKTKAEKQQASNATQSLNLARLNEMSVDEAEAERRNSSTPDAFLGVVEPSSQRSGGGDEEGLVGSDDEDEDARREEALTEEQREKVRDEKPFDTNLLTLNTNLKDLVKKERARRARNFDRKCNENPMLMDDEQKGRMPPASIHSNEYYQIATAHYKDLNAAGMLSYNAKVSHNGRMTLMHSRMDTWDDPYAADETQPTREFRNALSGLVENALLRKPAPLPNELFDECDRPPDKKVVLSTVQQLKQIGEKARDRVLENDDMAMLDQDEHVINDDEEAEGTASGGEEEGGRDEDNGKSSSSLLPPPAGGPSSLPDTNSCSSMAPSTPSAETEASEASTTRNSPKADKEKEEEELIKEDLGIGSQREDMPPRKKKLRKAAAIASMLTEDQIPGGPVLVADYLAEHFEKILEAKFATKVDEMTWKYGAFAEELHCDIKQIKEETQHVATNASLDLDMMHLDKMWTSKYYKKTLTEADVAEIKDRMRGRVSTEFFTKIGNYLRAGTAYEFFGHEDNWANPVIPPDETPHADGEEESAPLARHLVESQAEKKARRRSQALRERRESGVGGGGGGGVGAMGSDAEEEEENAADAEDEERITVTAACIEDDNPDSMADDGGLFDDIGSGFMSDGGGGGGNDDATVDDEAGSSSRRTDFTAGDDAPPAELIGDVHMHEPAKPSMEVRATGKTDDSHWKGGENPENATKVKKERKKKPKQEEGEESNILKCFDITDNMMSRVKLKKRFVQCTKNVDLMKDTDQLLMPSQVAVHPQHDYDRSLFYKPFLLPDTLHAKYSYRNSQTKDIVDPREKEDDEAFNLEQLGRLEHYSAMLETSMAEGGRDADDVYMIFMRTFKHYPADDGIATLTEMENREERNGEMATTTDEAAADESRSMISQYSAADEGGGAMGAMNDHHHDDNNDFDGGDDGGGGGGFDFDDDEGGVAEAQIAEAPVGTNLVSQQSERQSSVARSVAQSSTHGFGMRVDGDDCDNDEADAVATVGDREYQLRLIKLDTVAMKTALSDVLTNPLMEPEKLDETLEHFYRKFPSQTVEGEKKRKKAVMDNKAPMQTLNEDEEAEFEERERRGQDSDSFQDDEEEELDIEATMMEIPDAMNVTRALFAPPKEKAQSNKTVAFGGGEANSSQSRANSSTEHIHLNGAHTLKSAFTCLPARMPLRSTSDVTVASTIAMILHLANENNLILDQPGQLEGVAAKANTSTTTYGNWMNNFNVEPDKKLDKDGKRLLRLSQLDVLTSLSADEKPSDAERRQKMLVEISKKQHAEKAAKEARKSGAAARKSAANGTSSTAAAVVSASDVDDEDVSDDASDDVISDVLASSDEERRRQAPAFKMPAGRAGSSTAASAKKGTPRMSGNNDAADTTVQLDDTITIE